MKIVEDPLLIDLREAARLSGISLSTFLRLERTGRVGPRPIRLGRLVRIDRRELERWIAAGCPSRADWLRRRSA